MRPLGIWLVIVGLVRLSSVWFGFFDIWALRMAVFSKTEMSEIHGRTFGTWTLLTCTLCIICAYNLDNKPLYLATLLSFVYALGHFITEVFIFNTMALKNLATVSLFAVPSLVWMIVQYPKLDQCQYQKPKLARTAEEKSCLACCLLVALDDFDATQSRGWSFATHTFTEKDIRLVASRYIRHFPGTNSGGECVVYLPSPV